jgi:hypothetical protein
MREIEVDEQTHQRLFDQSRGFGDTPNDVIRRLLDLAERATEETGPVTRPSVDRRYIRRGERTHQREFHAPILLALDSLGGSGSTQHVVDVVGKSMEARFTDADRLPVPTGETRWRNSTRWARQHLVNAGLLDRSSPHGTWRLTDAGRREVDRLKQTNA